jgi:polar amino acid transport system substrate-binding protein
MSFKYYLSIFILLIPAVSEAEYKIKLAAENSWPPYSNGKGDGISKELIQRALANFGVDVEFIVVPYARALLMAQSGKVDGAFNVTKQSSTIDKFAFGEVAILQANASFYYHKESNLHFKTVDDIPKGTSIALIIDYEYGELYEKSRMKFNEIRVSSQKQIIKLLQLKRVDMAIMFDDVAKHYLTELELHKDEIKQGNTNHTSDIYVAFNKRKALSKVITLLDQGLLKIRAEQPLELESGI